MKVTTYRKPDLVGGFIGPKRSLCTTLSSSGERCNDEVDGDWINLPKAQASQGRKSFLDNEINLFCLRNEAV